jgi:hypothetical protein
MSREVYEVKLDCVSHMFHCFTIADSYTAAVSKATRAAPAPVPRAWGRAPWVVTYVKLHNGAIIVN